MWFLILILILSLTWFIPVPIEDPSHKKERWYEKY